MKKSFLISSMICVCLVGTASVNAMEIESTMMNTDMKTNHHMDMMNEGEYGIFTPFVKSDLTSEQITELKDMLSMREAGMPAMKQMFMDIKSGKLDKYEEFEKIATKRKAMSEKLKTFMSDTKGFDYLCMNHGDELLAKLFASDMIVNKYKKLFSDKYSDKITKLSPKKIKIIEKRIHMLYHNLIEKKQLRNFSKMRGLELVIEDIKNNRYKDVTKFIKKDLSELEKEALIELLGERAAAQGKFKKMLEDAKVAGNVEEVFEIIKGKRAGCAKRFEPFLNETMIDAFNKHCLAMGEMLKSKYIDNKYKDVSKFIKKDLSELEKEALIELLGERAAAQGKFKKMLEDAKIDGNVEEVFEIIKGKRAGCAKRFEQFLDEAMIDDFNKYCLEMGEMLKSKFID